MSRWLGKVHVGDCRELMRAMLADGVRVQCAVTSPPYWGLRDYGAHGQFGLERTWLRHVARMRGVFRLVRELLADDGVLWMNYGDCYAGAPGGWQGKNGQRASRTFTARIALEKKGRVIDRRSKQASNLASNLPRAPHRRIHVDLKPKDLVGMPWRVAFALQADGWYLRSDVVWHKPNPMPESVKDRPTKAHEYIFLLARSDQYYYDQDAIAEPSSPDSHARAARAHSGYAPPGQPAHGGWAARGVNPKAKPVAGWQSGPGSHAPIDHARAGKHGQKFPRSKQNESFSAAVVDLVDTRNVRTVWTIPTQPFPGAHFATFPEALVARCILAGSRPGDVIFDPFMGSGTVAKVAEGLGRKFVGCELNPEYAAMYGKVRPAQMGAPLR